MPTIPCFRCSKALPITDEEAVLLQKDPSLCILCEACGAEHDIVAEEIEKLVKELTNDGRTLH